MEKERLSKDPLWLYPEKPPAGDIQDAFRPWLDLYPVKTDRRLGTVLICPGGGYGGRAPHEGKDVAQRFNDEGFHAFVVQYRVSPHRHPAPMMDAARAIRIIRHRADEWKVDRQKIAICGFSAGGHLAASLGVHFDATLASVSDSIEHQSCRPDALILGYPVISSGDFGHRGSFRNLLGEDAPEEMLRKMSLELQVTDKTPPTFLWHTADDAGVPVENSLLFAESLRKHGIPFELHVYPHGRHGLGLAKELPHVATWMNLCCQWLREMGWHK